MKSITVQDKSPNNVVASSKRKSSILKKGPSSKTVKRLHSKDKDKEEVLKTETDLTGGDKSNEWEEESYYLEDDNEPNNGKVNESLDSISMRSDSS